MIARAVDDGGTNAILRLVICTEGSFAFFLRKKKQISHQTFRQTGPQKVTQSVHSSLNRKKRKHTIGIFNSQKEIL
jgi:hypothetical protein